MTDPVETDALRGVSERLADVPINGTMGQRMTFVRAQVELRTAADEVDRLRAVIENAPHGWDCTFGRRGQWRVPCTCWKAYAQ
jgi:hypothetical protein